MRKLSKAYRRSFAVKSIMVLRQFELLWLDIHHDGSEEAGPSSTGKIETQFGPVSFSVYDDWVAFNLDLHPGFVDGSPEWAGFSHWKQNYHTWAGQTEPAKRDPGHDALMLRKFIKAKFFNGVSPDPLELDRLRKEKAEKDRQFSKMFQDFRQQSRLADE